MVALDLAGPVGVVQRAATARAAAEAASIFPARGVFEIAGAREVISDAYDRIRVNELLKETSWWVVG
jgi:hypothetical protein